jgi:hypothetical protein
MAICLSQRSVDFIKMLGSTEAYIVLDDDGRICGMGVDDPNKWGENFFEGFAASVCNNDDNGFRSNASYKLGVSGEHFVDFESE